MNMINRKRNGQIDFFKFMFALMIVIYHFGNMLHTNHRIFSKGYIGVEFFFLVSGYLLAVSMEKVKDQKVDIKELTVEWKQFMKKKYVALWPIHFLAYVLTFLTFAHYMDWTARGSIHKMLDTIPEIFLVQMAGFQDNPIVGQAWYLSAMILVMLVIYPIFRNHYEWFSKVAAPVTAIVLVVYLQVHYKNLDIIVEKNGIIYAGVLRACAEIMLGIFMHAIGKRTLESIHTSSHWVRTCLTGTELFCYGAFILYAYQGKNTRWEFPLIFVIAVGIAISFSGKSYLAGLFHHRIFGYLGKVSFPIYLNQIWVRMVMVKQGLSLGWTKYMAVTVMATIAVSVITLLIMDQVIRVRRGSERKYYRQISVTGERK